MAWRNDVMAMTSIMLLMCAGLGYARGSRAGPPGQDAAKSGDVAKPTGEHGARPGGVASSAEPRPDDASKETGGRIAPGVYAELEAASSGVAYVAITLKLDAQETAGPEQIKASVKNVQDEVLARIPPGGFDLLHRFQTAALLVGRIDAAGLAQLGTEPDLVAVAPSKIEADVFAKLHSSEDGRVHVIVNLTRVEPGAPPSPEIKARVKEIQDRVLARLAPGEFKMGYRVSIIAYLSGHITAAGLAKLATDPDVVGVGVPGVIRLQLNESVPFMKADQVHSLGYTGAGVTVALLDSGVDCSHPDVQGSCADGGATFLGGQFGGGADDDIGHGTVMAAIITADNGVAPDAKVLPIKIASAALPGTVNDVVNAIDHVVDTKDAHSNLRVMNLSLDVPTLYAACPPCDPTDQDTQAFGAALDRAKAAGIITLASSGNQADCGMIGAPACVASAVAVAGVYDQTYPGLDWGVCQDLAPQPHLVVCASNRATIGCDQLGAPAYDISIDQPPPGAPTSGTSHAVAHASGVAALMIEKAGCPGLSPDEIAQIMDTTGTELTIMGMSCPGDEVPSSIDALDAINFFSGSCSAVGHPACNGDVTLIDFGIFIECMQGPDVPILPGSCTCVDYPEGGRQDADGDVDLRDFAAFQRDFTGWTDGACCHANGSCTDGPPPECFASNGLYQGNGTACASTDCPLPNWGACCQAGGSCAEETVEDCIWGEGLYLGDGTQCASVDCPTVAYQNFVLNPSSPTYTSCGSGLALADDMTLAPGSPNGLVYYDLTVYGGGVGSGTFDATVTLHTGWPPTGANQIAGTGFTWTDLPDGPAPAHLHAVMDPPVTIPDTVWMKADFSDQDAGWFIGGTAEIGSTQDYFGQYDPPWTLYWWEGDPHAGLWATLGCVEP